MELEYFRIIQVLIADPNLTRAAERLHLTQSALSKRVHAIETELGIQLFERRGPRGLRALPQALEMGAVAERVLTAWDSGKKRVQALSSEPEHFLLIGPPLFLREVILPWWLKANTEFPNMHLEVKSSSLSRISLDAIQTGADAAILEHKEELADYVCKSIYTEKWGIVRNPEVKFPDLRNYIWGTTSLRENPVNTWLVQRQKLSAPSYRVMWDDLTALAVWVSETRGAATVLPWHSVAWLVKRDKLIFEPLGGDAVTRLYLAYEVKNPNRRFIKELMKISEL